MKRVLRATAAAMSLLLVGLAGCAGQGAMTAPGQTAAYQEGFADGCRSGRAAAGSPVDSYRRNAGRFESDKDYAEGWSAGHQRCEYEQMQKNAQGGP